MSFSSSLSTFLSIIDCLSIQRRPRSRSFWTFHHSVPPPPGPARWLQASRRSYVLSFFPAFFLCLGLLFKLRSGDLRGATFYSLKRVGRAPCAQSPRNFPRTIQSGPNLFPPAPHSYFSTFPYSVDSSEAHSGLIESEVCRFLRADTDAPTVSPFS